MTSKDAFVCTGCGEWVYPYQVHNCSGIRAYPIDMGTYTPIVRATPEEIELVPAVKVTLNELKRVYKLFMDGKLVEVKE